MKLKILPALIFMFCLSSCDKADRLNEDAQKIEAERQAVQAEADDYHRRYVQLTSTGSVSATQLEKITMETLKKASEVETAATAKTRKWESIEAAMKPIKARVDSWKAKFLK